MKCAYYRWRISTALDSADPAARLPHRHLAGCAACREFARRCESLGAALAAEPAPAGARVVAGLRPTARAPLWQTATAVAAAAALLVAAMVIVGRGPEREVVVVAPPDDGGTPVEAADVRMPSADEMVAYLRESAVSLAQPVGRPVALEVTRMRTDITRAGERLLALLPAQPPGGAQAPDEPLEETL